MEEERVRGIYGHSFKIIYRSRTVIESNWIRLRVCVADTVACLWCQRVCIKVRVCSMSRLHIQSMCPIHQHEGLPPMPQLQDLSETPYCGDKALRATSYMRLYICRVITGTLVISMYQLTNLPSQNRLRFRHTKKGQFYACVEIWHHITCWHQPVTGGKCDTHNILSFFLDSGHQKLVLIHAQNKSKLHENK